MVLSPKCGASWRRGLAFALVLLAPGPGLAQITVLDMDVKRLLKKEGVLAESIPSGEFVARDLLAGPEGKGIDPLVLVAHWEQVRPQLQRLYKDRLALKAEPDLRLRWLWVNRDRPKEPKRLRLVFADPGNFKVRKSLVSVLGLPARSFEGFALVRTEIAPADSILVEPPKKIKEIDWKAIRSGLEKVFQAKELARLKLKIATGEPPPPGGILVYTQWQHLGDVEQVPRSRYYWRVEIRLSRASTDKPDSPSERWLLKTAVPIARKAPRGGYQTVVKGDDSNVLDSQAIAVLRPISTRSFRAHAAGKASVVLGELWRGKDVYHTRKTDGTCVEPRVASGLGAVAERVFALATRAVREAPGFEGSVTAAPR